MINKASIKLSSCKQSPLLLFVLGEESKSSQYKVYGQSGNTNEEEDANPETRQPFWLIRTGWATLTFELSSSNSQDAECEILKNQLFEEWVEFTAGIIFTSKFRPSRLRSSCLADRHGGNLKTKPNPLKVFFVPCSQGYCCNCSADLTSCH